MDIQRKLKGKRACGVINAAAPHVPAYRPSDMDDHAKLNGVRQVGKLLI